MKKEIEEKEKWDSLRQILKNSYAYNDSWNEAINLFESILQTRYFNPLHDIIKEEKLEGEGFTIVTVQCALIESLAAFRKGKIFNHKKESTSPQYEYSSSSKMFIDFLHSASIFEDNFYRIDDTGKTIKNEPFSAEGFYTCVRCGLMHEARTKGRWIINATKNDVKNTPIFLEADGQNIKILRTILHHRLESYVQDYCSELREDSQPGEVLRRYFARKLDHMFDISRNPRNQSYDWWEDR